MHVRGTRLLDLFLLISKTCIVDHNDFVAQPWWARSQPPPEFDNSRPFFSLYSQISEEKDNKIAESWQKALIVSSFL